MLAETQRRPPGTWIPDCATWAWSDLHLHHRNIMRYTNRPFARCEQMDGAAHGAWRQVVGDAAVICGGDVALAGSLNAQRLDRVATFPGATSCSCSAITISPDAARLRSGWVLLGALNVP